MKTSTRKKKNFDKIKESFSLTFKIKLNLRSIHYGINTFIMRNPEKRAIFKL